jgi:predicted transcriptional regulator
MTTETTHRSALTELRQEVPLRALSDSETYRVLERQAAHLLRLSEIAGPPVPIEAIATSIPWIEVNRVPRLRTSGRAQWDGTTWVIFVNASESTVVQRYTLAHELAHIVWHPLSALTLPSTAASAANQRIERACEYFADCLLMPRKWMGWAYGCEGIRDIPSLSRLFRVPRSAMRMRARQLGFIARGVGSEKECT